MRLLCCFRCEAENSNRPRGPSPPNVNGARKTRQNTIHGPTEVAVICEREPSFLFVGLFSSSHF